MTGPAFAASYEINDFTTPATAVSYSGTGTGSPASDVSISYNLVSTLSYGAGSLTVSSLSVNAFAQIFISATGANVSGYNCYELSFTGATGTALNINNEMYSSSGNTASAINVSPSGGAFDVFLPIALINGFNPADVTGFLFEIETSNDSTGWTMKNFQLTTTAPTPLPAALPLFAGGIGGLGLLGWRARRKARTRAA